MIMGVYSVGLLRVRESHEHDDPLQVNLRGEKGNLTASNLVPRLCQIMYCEHIRYTKPAPTEKTDDDLLKSVRKYTRTARKAWEAMSIPEDQNIDFEGKHTKKKDIQARGTFCEWCFEVGGQEVRMVNYSKTLVSPGKCLSCPLISVHRSLVTEESSPMKRSRIPGATW